MDPSLCGNDSGAQGGVDEVNGISNNRGGKW
jgi:hypothetical protein